MKSKIALLSLLGLLLLLWVSGAFNRSEPRSPGMPSVSTESSESISVDEALELTSAGEAQTKNKSPARVVQGKYPPKSSPNKSWGSEVDRLLAEKKTSEAIALLKAQLEKDPANYEVAADLGFLYEELGNQSEAKNYFEKALSQNPENGEALRHLVDLYHSSQDGVRGREFLEDVLARRGDSLPANLAMADLLLKQGQFQQAMDYAQRASTLPGGLEQGSQMLGTIQAVSGDAPRAIETYASAIDSEKQNSASPERLHDLHLNKAEAHAREGDRLAAEEELKNLPPQDPDRRMVERKYRIDSRR